MSAVKAEKAMKRITKKSAFLLWSEEDAVMNNSLPRFRHRISTINGLVKKNRKLATGVFHCERSSSEKLRWAVASTREQKRRSEHPAFLADGTDIDVDPADSDQLFLPGLLFAVLFC